MKVQFKTLKFLVFILLIFTTRHSQVNTLYAQTPQQFNYQAVARNGDIVLNDATIDVKFDIFRGENPGISVWNETHTNVATSSLGLFSVKVGSIAALDDIDWTAGPYFLKVQLNLGSGFQDFGSSELLSVPYALNSQSVSSLDKLGIRGDAGMDPDSALFEVKRNDGQTVFAVYNSGVRIYVEEGEGKGNSRGGFAVGGFKPGKASVPTGEYFRVTPDSVRIYLDNTATKGSRGGFAVGGFTPGKGMEQEYLKVTKDSTRVYINNTDTKKSRGGFAIGGFTPGKGPVDNYLAISTHNEAEIINPSQPRILWYPKKEAFLSGRVLIEHPDSVGFNSMATGFESKSIGNYSQAFGYKSRSFGHSSTAIGNYAQSIGATSFALGEGAISKGIGSYAIGSIGRDTLGNLTNNPTTSIGNHSVAIGLGAKATKVSSYAIGTNVEASGISSLAMGYESVASNQYATALGFGSTASGYSSFASGQWSTASGRGSVALGFIARAYGNQSNAIGYRALADADYSTAIGAYAPLANAENATAIGNLVQATNQFATALGYDSDASGYGSLAAGYKSSATGSYSFAAGYNNITRGTGAVALGYSSEANSSYSVAIGRNATASGFQSMAFGAFITASGRNAIGLNCAGTTRTISKDYSLGIFGFVGINDGYPTYALELPNNSSTTMGYGRAFAWVTYSDKRIKKNASPLEYGLKDIMLLTPLSYDQYSAEIKDGIIDFTNDYKREIGLFAQDVFEVIPEVASKPENPDNDLWSMNYEKLVPVLIKGMQEQQAEILQLMQEIEELKTMLSSMKHD